MNSSEVAQLLRDAANRWALEYATSGMPRPMPLTMYPDAWLRAEAARIEAEASTSDVDYDDFGNALARAGRI